MKSSICVLRVLALFVAAAVWPLSATAQVHVTALSASSSSSAHGDPAPYPFGGLPVFQCDHDVRSTPPLADITSGLTVSVNAIGCLDAGRRENAYDASGAVSVSYSALGPTLADGVRSFDIMASAQAVHYYEFVDNFSGSGQAGFSVTFTLDEPTYVKVYVQQRFGGSVTTNFPGVNQPGTPTFVPAGTYTVSGSASASLSGFGGNNSQAEIYLEFDTHPRRPVLLIPGIGATFSKDRDLDLTWLASRGLHPNFLQIDPLSKAYDDLIQTLKDAGYVEGHDLFIVNYDWRLMPGPIDGTIDGVVSGLSPSSISDTTFQYGVDYLGFYLRKAAEAWAIDHPDQPPLASVDIIAHSTGGLVARTYIQSGAAVYGGEYDFGLQLPKVEHLVMVGVPNRGASKAWNPLHDEWGTDATFQLVLSKIVNRAFNYVDKGGTISGPDHVITKAMLNSTASCPEGPKVCFIKLYIPTARALLATYDFLDLGSGPTNVNADASVRNSLLLDLNAGLDDVQVGDPNSFANDAQVTVIYGTNGGSTPTQAIEEQAPGSGVPAVSFSDVIAHTLTSGTYYRDVLQNQSGDGTVPLESSIGQFITSGGADPRVTLLPFTDGGNTTDSVGHVDLMSNPDVQTAILKAFGLSGTTPISTSLHSSQYTTALCASSGYFCGNIQIDPVEGFLVDGLGRRLGYTLATGRLEEIPGSMWFGTTDGIGWVQGPLTQPLMLRLTGLDGSYRASVSVVSGAGVGGVNVDGVLPIGAHRDVPIMLGGTGGGGDPTTPVNTPPVADAGADQHATVGDMVQIDGVASHDADGNPLVFTWSWTSLPAGSAALFTNAAAVQPFFVPDVPGTFVAQLIVNDGTINSIPDTVTITVIGAMDNTAPTAVLDAPSQVAVGANLVVSGSGSSDVGGHIVSYRWQLDANPVVVTSSPSFTFTAAGNPLTIGFHTVTLHVVDDSGNSSAPDTRQVLIGDNVAPTAVIDGPPATPVGTSVLVFGAGSFDVGGHIVSYRWQLDAFPVVATTTTSFAFTPAAYPLAVGLHHVTLRVVDDSGNESAPDTLNVIIADSIAPTAVITGPASIAAGANLAVSGANSTDVGGHVVSYRWQLDAFSVVETSSPTFTFTAAAYPLAVGPHTVTLRVIDDSANESSPATHSVIVRDTVAPTAVITAPNSINIGANLTVSGSNSIDVGGHVVEYQWRLDAFSPVVSPDPSFTFTNATYPLALGLHTVTLTVVDDSGNSSSPATHNVIVRDTVAPTAVITAPNTINVGADLTVSGSKSSDVAGHVVEYQWRLDAFSPVVSPDPSFTFTNATYPLALGRHTVTLTVVDDSGNSSSPATHDVIVRDSIAPTAVITAPNTINVGADLTVSGANSSDVGGHVAQYQWRLDAFPQVVSSDPSFTFTAATYPLAVGRHTITLNVVDDSDNISSPATHDVIVRDTVAPTAVITAPNTLNFGADLTVSGANSSDVGGRVVEYQWRLDSFGLVVSPDAAFTFTNASYPLAVGRHTVTLTVIDDSGNTSSPTTHDVIVRDTVAPTAVITAPNVINFGAALTVSGASSSDVGGHVVEYQWRLDAFAPVVSPDPSFTFSAATYPLAGGHHTVTLNVVDDSGNTSSPATHDVIVRDTVAPVAVITAPNTLNFGADLTVSGAKSSDVGGRVVEYQWRLDAFAPVVSPDPSFTFSNATYPLALGRHTLTLTVQDDSGNSSAPATHDVIVRDTVAPVAVITAPNAINFGADLTVSGANSSDVGGRVVEYRWQLDAFGPVVSSDPSFTFGSATFPLALGRHTVTLTVTDDSGNASSPATHDVIVRDSIAPTAVIAAPSVINVGASLTVSGANSTDVGGRVVQYRWQLDAFGEVVSPDPSFTFTAAAYPLAAGSHTVTLRVVDDSGNTSAPATRNVVVADSVPPTAAITGPASIALGTNLAVSGANSSDVGGQIVSYRWQLDATPTVVTSTPTFTFTAAAYPLGVGGHTVTLHVVDDSGNTSLPATLTVQVVGDLTPPDTTITSGPSGTVASTSASFTFTSTESGSTFQCAFDGASFGACPAGYTGLSQGAHVFSVRATDPSGNVDQTPATRSFIVDTVAPDTTITAGPSGTIASTTASFTFTSTEAGSSFQCALDGAAFGACPVSYTGLAQGNHGFAVRAIDAAGNVDATPATRSFTVDTLGPPDTTITSGPSGTVASTSATFTFTSSQAGSTFQCALDGAGFGACPAGYAGLSQGSHVFAVRAINVGGSVDATPATRSFIVDTVAPDTTITAGPSGTIASTTASFTFTSTEAGSTFQCALDGAAFGACPVSYTGLAQGSHAFAVRAIDAAGNVDATPATRSFTVSTDSVPPDTTITSGPSGLTSVAFTSFGFAATEPGTFACRLDGPGSTTGAYQSCNSPRVLGVLANGSYTFFVRATDSAGNVDQTPASRSFTIDTAAPETSLTSGPSGQTNITSWSFAFTSSEPGATFECRLDGPGFMAGTTRACVAGQNYGPLAEGTYTFRVRATDAAGNADPSPATRTFTIDTTPPDTAILLGPSGNTTNITPTFVFLSGLGTTFECRVDGPLGQGTFQSCPSPLQLAPLAKGAYTFQVRAIDAAGNVDPTPAIRTFTER